jgi:hypothetical protein
MKDTDECVNAREEKSGSHNINRRDRQQSCKVTFFIQNILRAKKEILENFIYFCML